MQKVIIIGGGLVGTPAAIALAQQNIPVTVIDQQPPDVLLDPLQDGRTTAVSYGSKLIFEELGCWQAIEPYASPIWHVRVFEEDSPWQVSYDAQDMGPHPLGYIVSNLYLRQVLWTRAQELPSLTWLAPAQVKHQERTAKGVQVTLASGEVLTGQLLIAAEGKNSPTRAAAGISQHLWTYEHVALTGVVHHTKPHEGVAWEVFSASGPYALLPLLNCPETNMPRSGIVYTTMPIEAQQLLQMTDAALSTFLTEKFRLYGPLQWMGPRWHFPLSAMKINRLIDTRLAVIGDAAHVVHPVAGQGVNLGWRDAAGLAHEVTRAFRLGLDIGGTTILKRFETKRRTDHRQMLQMTDGMVRLFGNRSTLLYFLRNTGFAAVNHLPPLKRLLMRHAAGL